MCVHQTLLNLNYHLLGPPSKEQSNTEVLSQLVDKIEENVYSFLMYGKFFLIIFSGTFLITHFVSMNLNDFLLNFCSGVIRGIALIFIINSARHLPSSLFAPTQYIQIFAGAVLGFLIFGDIPTLNNYLGNILIIGAGLYIIIREVALSRKIVTIAARPATIPTGTKE